MAPSDITDAAAYKGFQEGQGPKAVLFYTPGDPPSEQLLQLLPLLQQDLPGVPLASVDATAASSCLKANAHVTRCPTVNFLWGTRQVGQLVGSDVPAFVSCLKILAASTEVTAAAQLQQQLGVAIETEEELNQRLSRLIKKEPVMLFMKGKREAPFCRFSKATLALLEEQGVINFGTFDVFDDAAVREGLKTFSDWPTYPQLYVNGELIGGLDVLKAMVADGSFKAAFPPSAFAS